MFMENGEEALMIWRNETGEHTIAVDEETYAHLLNQGWEPIKELYRFTRLPMNHPSVEAAPEVLETK